MIKLYRLLPGLCLSCILPLQVFAQAPVVDDSENFAILDEQQVAVEQPVAKAQLDNNYNEDEEVALAQDNRDSAKDNAGLLNKIQGLQQEVQELRGQLEVQAHDLKILQQQQLAFYKDLDTRLAGGKVTAPSTKEQSMDLSVKPRTGGVVLPQQQSLQDIDKPLSSGLINASGSNPAEEQISYMAAYDLVKSKRFDDALTAMQAFVAQYPHGGYTANAQYWLGELYLVKNNYAQAITHFDTVLKQFPSSSKAAASTLKIGYALAASGKENEARLRLQQVLKNYPDTPTAQLAARKLEILGVS